MSDPLMSAKEAAKFLGVAEQSLANWRATRRYPLSYVKVGSRVAYKLSDLQRFVESRTVSLADPP